jgi:hypothetical protein
LNKILDANKEIALPNHLHHGRGLHSHIEIEKVAIRLSAATSIERGIEILNDISDEIGAGTFPPR